MFASDRRSRRLLIAALTLLMPLAAACDDPTLARPAPGHGSMTLFLILDPDASVQPLLVKPAGVGGDMDGLAGEVRRAGALIATVPWPRAVEDNGHLPCVARYGPIRIAPYCLPFEFRPEHGATYSVAAAAHTYPSATGSTTVPGEFQITEVDARGELPGTGGLQVRWTSSEGVYRYVVAVRPTRAPSCVEMSSCEQGWYVATRDTSIDTVVPPEALAGGSGPWNVDVYSMDEALYQYLTTGTSGNLFPVGAVQNVAGGFGAVGSWVRRTETL